MPAGGTRLHCTEQGQRSAPGFAVWGGFDPPTSDLAVATATRALHDIRENVRSVAFFPRCGMSAAMSENSVTFPVPAKLPACLLMTHFGTRYCDAASARAPSTQASDSVVSSLSMRGYA